MKKKEMPKYYVMYKEFNSGKVESYEILEQLFNTILTSNGKISKKNFVIYDDKEYTPIPVTTKEQLAKFMKDYFMYLYWSKCEWEFIVVDWPYREYKIENAVSEMGNTIYSGKSGIIDLEHPVKIDVYDQIEPNLPILVDVVWNYIEDKIGK